MLLTKCHSTHSVRKRTVRSSSVAIQSPLMILDHRFLNSRQHMHSACVDQLFWQLMLRSHGDGCGILGGRWCSSGNIGSSYYGSKSTFLIKIYLILSNFVGSCVSILTVCNVGSAWTRIHMLLSQIPPDSDQRPMLKR